MTSNTSSCTSRLILIHIDEHDIEVDKEYLIANSDFFKGYFNEEFAQLHINTPFQPKLSSLKFMLLENFFDGHTNVECFDYFGMSIEKKMSAVEEKIKKINDEGFKMLIEYSKFSINIEFIQMYRQYFSQYLKECFLKKEHNKLSHLTSYLTNKHYHDITLTNDEVPFEDELNMYIPEHIMFRSVYYTNVIHNIIDNSKTNYIKIVNMYESISSVNEYIDGLRNIYDTKLYIGFTSNTIELVILDDNIYEITFIFEYNNIKYEFIKVDCEKIHVSINQLLQFIKDKKLKQRKFNDVVLRCMTQNDNRPFVGENSHIIVNDRDDFEFEKRDTIRIVNENDEDCTEEVNAFLSKFKCKY